MEKLCKASAWYFTAYKAGAFLSFGWILNHLMCDISQRNPIRQEEHQAWTRIGEAICNTGFQLAISNTAAAYELQSNKPENSSDVEILGWQFLTLIDKCNETAERQKYADNFLMFLHQIALNIF